MAIKKTTTPYELLVRWGKSGKITGAHVKFLDRIDENGDVLAEKEGHAIPVSLAGEAGYPLADILSTLQSSALATVETTQAALAAKETELATEKTAHENAKTLLANKDAEIAAKNAEIAAVVAELNTHKNTVK